MSCAFAAGLLALICGLGGKQYPQAAAIIKLILLKTTTPYGIFLPVHLKGKYSHGSKQDPHI
jgi:hypothetical protein